MIANQDYARIHDLVKSEEYLLAAGELLLLSRSAVADFIKSYAEDEGVFGLRSVIRLMTKLENASVTLQD